jgi:sterol desaturase/sphingolipid hydroxylase (fatty acid hydroxylase superfamily)
VIAGPVFHRWHHTAAEHGGEKNFAPTFPVLDLLFGTFYMPKQTLPDRYGIADKTFPANFCAQMLYPFRREAAPGASFANDSSVSSDLRREA